MVVDAESPRDRRDPRAKAGAVVEPVEGVEGTGESLLGDVFAERAVAQLAPAERDDVGDVP